MEMMPMQQPAGDQFVSPEKKEELLQMIRTMKEKLRGFRATRVGSANKQESLRRETLNEVFKTLSAAGIDLSDQASVSNFLNDLRQKNPELADMFDKAMDSILGNDESDYVQDPNQLNSTFDPTAFPENNNMNIAAQNEGISKNS